MKKVVIVILFLSVTAGFTFLNVKKDPSCSDKRIKNIEALASGEGDNNNPCKIIGGICIYYDENGQQVLVSGMTLGEKPL